MIDPLCSLSDVSAAMSSTGGALPPEMTLDVESAINAASRAVEQWCGRDFYPQTSSARVFGADRVCWVNGYQELRLDDCSAITAIASDDSDSGTFGTTWTVGTDCLTLPLNGRRSGIPSHAIDGIRSYGSRTFRCSGARPVVSVTATWGWATIPDPVARATRMIAADLIKRKEAPFGIAGFGDFGAVRVSGDVFRQVQGILAAYCRVGGLGLGGFA